MEKNIEPRFDFQGLTVYKKAKDFHIACKTLAKAAGIERYARDQVGRASYSIVLNIAEGSAKSSRPDRRNYFTTSRASVFECVAVIDLLRDQNLIDDDHYDKMLGHADQLSRILYAMIKNLS